MNYFEARNVKSDFYDNYIMPLYMKKLLPKQKEVCILDFGCGFGQTLLALKKDGYNNIVGVDIEKSAIEFCKSKGLDVKDCSNLDGFIKLNQNQFDLVIISHVLEHFPKNEIIPTLKKIKSIMKKRGVVLVMAPNAQSNTNCYWAYEDFTHTTLFTSGSLYYVLKMAGFSSIEFIDIDCIEGLSFFKKVIKKSFLRLYKINRSFWNRITSSSYHKPSPQVFSYEIKVFAKNV